MADKVWHIFDDEEARLGLDHDQNTKRIMRALGASMGNFIYTYSETIGMARLTDAFASGFSDFVEHCRELDRPKSRTPLRLVEFMNDGVDGGDQED